MASRNVVYEVNIEIRRERVVEFDAWLTEHIGEMLALPGFVDARTFASDLDAGTALRSIHYRLNDRAALDRYLDVHAPAMRAQGIERFGDDMQASRLRVVFGQGRFVTVLKLGAITLTYVIGAAIVGLVGAAVTALSI